MRRAAAFRSDYAYRRRLLGALAVVLALGVALVRWWPAPSPRAPDGPFGERSADRIQINEVQPTAQAREQTPPPPAPAPPKVVPNNVVIEDKIEFGTSALAVDVPGDDDQLRDGTTDTPRAARTPDTNARLFRAVQPDYPTAAREASVQARVRVAVQVSETGRVTGATVLKRWRLPDEGRARTVARLDHGLEEAALVAARRSRFRPAQQNGQPVVSQTTLTFEFGTSE
ncbi:energy transducer TonB [Salinibacter ruber]|uniref:Outer membrane biosynthesis protein TonB n=1 Tax=Salinibacter ruber TaxID=146919 RepID=A0A9X2ULG9_9BACT|nr:energy transducer TonB [Salinibacter ruber]MCS3612310.1 outer membrane biosynthesis protein TonB [Salinibacter ruber]MCS3615789.1 outer membrane biosynthesis protein TonB [Salinibacter ruber]MCS3674429.1 outer membrane biosynthesis protein TonB [Salinibacter ruber]MCS3784320.1 outer membrane biosynthesis protein TonB [Salinibacter ruber]MCS4036847.1 outer membrane biosynthesis protein TonB [Salinibacter ruber]